MKISKCSLIEYKETFPEYKEEEDSNLNYYKVELENKEFIGVVKDTTTKLFNFTGIDKAESQLINNPNFEYELLSLFAEDYEPKNFDSPIVEPTVNIYELEDRVVNELNHTRLLGWLKLVLNIVGIIVVILIIIVAMLYAKGKI